MYNWPCLNYATSQLECWNCVSSCQSCFWKWLLCDLTCSWWNRAHKAARANRLWLCSWETGAVQLLMTSQQVFAWLMWLLAVFLTSTLRALKERQGRERTRKAVLHSLSMVHFLLDISSKTVLQKFHRNWQLSEKGIRLLPSCGPLKGYEVRATFH